MNWEPIETAPEETPIWLANEKEIWCGEKIYEDGWCFTNCYGTQYFAGGKWQASLSEFDDDYKPTKWMPLPPPPNE